MKKENQIILAYSAIKIRENFKPPYSTLNPETNSDSPSAKSKGARLVSAKQQIKHIKNNWKEKKKTSNRPLILINTQKSRE